MPQFKMILNKKSKKFMISLHFHQTQFLKGVLLICLLSICFSLKAQTFASLTEAVATGTIKGQITSTDGNPVEFVNIMLKGSAKGAISVADGYYQIKNIKAGDYKLVATYVGLQAQEKEVTVIAGEVINVDFILPKNSQQLSEVIITDKKTLNQKPVSVGKIAIAPMDLPQSVVTIEREVLEQQQALHLSEVLQNVNGVYQMGNTGGTQEEIASRGFAMSSSNTFKNGSRFNNGVMPELTSVERVEVLKGSNAILYGNVAAGGVLNLITKKPKFEKGGEISMRLGSYNFYKPSLDIYGSVNNSQKVAYRLNTTYEKANSFRDVVNSERFYINPSLLVKAGNKTEILIEGDYLKDNRVPDYGIGAINYSIPDVPRNRFLGATWANYEAIQKTATTTVTHQLTANWKLQAVASYQDFLKDEYGTGRPSSTNIKEDGSFTRTLQRTGSFEKYYLGQLDLNGEFTTGFLKHNFLVGTDVDRYRTETSAFNIYADRSNPAKVSTAYDVINILNPESWASQRTDIPAAVETEVTLVPTNRVGAYVQDLVHLTEKLKVLGGVRYSYQRTGSGSAKLYDDAFSPRAGVVYQPTKATSVFASYANSFATNTGVDINNQALAPSIIDQYEIGVKNDLFKGLLSANVTVYKINNSNVAQQVLTLPNGTSNTNTSIKELAGTTASEGLEIDLMSKSFHGFSFIGGYSYNDTKFIKSSVNVEGSRLRYNPAHTANASIFYTLSSENKLNGLNFGLTSFYIGDRLAGRSTRTNVADDTWRLMPLPDYFLFDTHVGYTLDKLTLRVKLTNLFNQLSYNAHDDNSINPIAPRQFSTTLSYRF